ncbi:MAG: MATE family efflux transporter [Firmicutes bacterium]|nr:MATE family efflux transporter [Bacillota bacterium]
MSTLQIKEENFYRKLTVIGIPMIIQQVIAVTLNLADTIMVGKVSENALAAVGAANQVYFIFSVVLFGIFSGAAVHAVQYWGIRDLVSLRKIVGIDYTMCLVLSVPTVAVVFAAAPLFIRLFSQEPEVIELGTQYMKIACFSYIFAALSFVISYNSRSIQDLKYPTIINACAIAMNIFLNYVFIYGNFGVPALGVRGAAIATTVSRILECVAMMLSVYLRKEHPLKAYPSQLFCYSRELLVNVMKTAVPVIITEGMWAFSVSAIFAAYGKISASALAISQIAVTVTDFFQTIYFGLGNASSVIIGEVLGQGRRSTAFEYSGKVLKVTWILNIIMTAVIIIARAPIAAIYDFSPETTEMLMKALLVYAVALTPKMLAYMTICAILRAGGDTVFCMYMDVAFNVGLQIPLAYIGVLVLKWPLHWVMAFVAIADFIKVFFCYYRYYSKKWMNIFTGREEISE